MVSWIKGCVPPALVALLLLLSCAHVTAGQDAGRQLLELPVRKVKIKEATNVHLTLSALANEYGVPIGLEVAAAGGQGPKISLDLEGRPLREVLDAVTAQDQRYEWKLVGGVINVFPREGRGEFLRDLLEMRISRFAVEKGTGLFDIRRLIVETPEVRAKLERAGVGSGGGGFVTNADFAEAGPGFKLDASGLTLQ